MINYCPKCSSPLEKLNKDGVSFDYCSSCWQYIDFEKCTEHEMNFVRVHYSNNSFHIRKKCGKCGYLSSELYKKSETPNWEKFPIFSLASSEDESNKYTMFKDLFERYYQKSKEVKRHTAFDDFLKEHQEYLESDEWKIRRKKVLQRDNFLCQSCLESPAVEVHHKSYRFWKKEPLFDLVSVCKKCHVEITNQTREIFDLEKFKRNGDAF